MLKTNDAFFPNPETKKDLPAPASESYLESYESNVSGIVQNEGGQYAPVVKKYNTWGPQGLKSNPFRIPFWPVLVGLALFVGLQTLYSIPFLLYATFQNVDVLEPGADPSVVQEQIQNDLISAPLVLGSLLLGWGSFIFAVWLASRRYSGGWKGLTLWKFKWLNDILIALAFVLVVRGLEILVGIYLESAGLNQEDLSNSQFLTDFTGITFVAILFGAGIVAPIVEELFFRGLFLRSVTDKVWVALTTNTPEVARKKDITVATVIGLVVAVFGVVMSGFAISGFSNQNNDGDSASLFSSTTFLFAYIMSLLVGVLIGFLYYKLKDAKSKGVFAGLIISSLAFGIMHTQATGASSFYTIGFTTVIGFALAGLYLITGRLGTAVMAHIFVNSSAVLLVIYSTITG